MLFHFFHCGKFKSNTDAILPSLLQDAFELGSHGVAVFFVLSGCVIAYAIRTSRITPTYYGNFIIRRIVRLDPPYWFAIVAAISLNVISNSVSASPEKKFPEFPTLVANVLYLQYLLGFKSVSPVFWTLCLEVQFYLFFVLLAGTLDYAANQIGYEKRGGGLLNLLVLTPLAAFSLFAFDDSSTYGADPFLWRYFHLFFLGILTCWVISSRVSKYAFYFALCTAAGWAFNTSDHETMTAVITASVIYLVGCANRLSTLGNWWWLQYFGAISYSLYLLHVEVGDRVISLGHKLMPNCSAFAAILWLVAAIVASVLAADLMYRYVERPTKHFASTLKRS